MQPPILLIDRADGFVVAKSAGMDDLLDLIVWNQRLAVQLDNQNSMQNFQIEVLPNHNPHMIRIKPEDQQRAVYADCVIFADAGFVSELIWRCT
ncbi:MAG: hypothetical protein VX900_08465, partial [Pseudomonadota bacterium]|nr:hypothetical protein [Pseudomonadota bacterium]